jgi:hypothetical protein
MTSVELKKILIRRIAEINDEQFLKAIVTILDSKVESDVKLLSEGQRSEIQESRKEIRAGKFIEQSDIEAEFGKWLKEK